MNLADTLSPLLNAEDIIIPGSSGVACEYFLSSLKVKQGQRVFHAKGTGTMGYTVPAALGAALASGRRVIAVDGDGSFAASTAELATIRSLNLPVHFFILTNGGWGSITASQTRHFGRVSNVMPEVLVEGIADAYNIDYYDDYRVFGRGSFDGPTICEVRV